jgi:Family of unknown function (DUF5989)
MDDRGESKFEKVSAKNSTLLGEIIGFMLKNKKFWLLPIMLCFVLIGVVALLSTTAAAPFIYTFF